MEIVGRRNGYFSADDEAKICDEINRSGADVVWVGLGVPLEYAFCLRNKARLQVGWIVTCGGCFNFAAGQYVRAPQWMQKAGLEWLHRLWREPKRLFWRYLITNPIAMTMLLLNTASTKSSMSRPRPALRGSIALWPAASISLTAGDGVLGHLLSCTRFIATASPPQDRSWFPPRILSLL